jgi:Domain of unknown function (DUF1877)
MYLSGDSSEHLPDIVGHRPLSRIDVGDWRANRASIVTSATMSMAARLQMVTDKEIDLLVREPGRINRLNNEGFGTHWFQTISFMLCGDAWPSAKHKRPLTAVFFGYETVDTTTLENGNFGIVRPGDVKAIAKALAAVDLMDLKTRVEQADDDEMADAECEDFEILKTDDEDPGETVVDDVEGLQAFYAKASKLGRGVVMYAS